VSISRSISALFLRIAGWEAEGSRPESQRFVLIAAPHTSNWDLAFLLALAQIYGIRVSWMGKHTLFRGPMGGLMRRLGGIPVRRDRSSDLVAQMASAIQQSDAIALTVPVEGTRGYTPHWKSGFYHIARSARVPVVMGFLDYERRRGGFGPELLLTEDIRTDMDKIRAFYRDKRGRYPEKAGEIRLKEEM
jgi:1-acyl-sn-glycerol-3-phosphate acyltransferase